MHKYNQYIEPIKQVLCKEAINVMVAFAMVLIIWPK